MRTPAFCFTLAAALHVAPVGAGDAASLQARYAAEAGAGFSASAARGQALWTARHTASAELESCARCHGPAPGSPGRHAITGKAIAPMAPRLTPARFTDAAKSEKWFRRNCREVIGRDCNAGEKADLLAFLREEG